MDYQFIIGFNSSKFMEINRENRNITIHSVFLPPANEVLGKVMFFDRCVILFTGGLHLRDLHPRGLHPGESASRESALRGRRGLSRPPPSDTTGYGKRVGSTHPTGMHFCTKLNSENYFCVQSKYPLGEKEIKTDLIKAMIC